MHLLKAGVNVIYNRDLLGHADVSTTEIYARADPETKRKAIENAYESLTPPSPCPAGQPTKISSNGSTTSADNRPGYVAGTGFSARPSKENTPAGHITQPST
jgi:hypothetical protein